MEVTQHNINKKQLFNTFLPSLIGTVFHFTFLENWIEIQKCGQLQINTNGKFSYGSIHSHNSMGNHLRAICLFDLRGKNNFFLGEGTIFHDFFERRVKDTPCCFLVLSQKSYSSITTLRDIDDKLKEEKMFIPEIESWHIGNLDLEKVEHVHEVVLRTHTDLV